MTAAEDLKTNLSIASVTPLASHVRQLGARRLLCLILILVGSTLAASGEDSSTSPQRTGQRPGQTDRGVIALLSGDAFQGSLRAGTSDGLVGWRGGQFLDPFQFRVGAIQSIKFGSEKPDVAKPAPLHFELTNGDLIHGELVAFTNDFVRIRCDGFGEIGIPPDSLTRMRRADNDNQVGMTSLKGLDGWRSNLESDGAWQEDGNHIWTAERGATIARELNLPMRAVIDLELSWTGAPDFVIAIGVDPDTNGAHMGEGWHMETAGNELALVREEERRADVAPITSLLSRNRIRLVGYLDRLAGTMSVLNLDGSVSASVSLSATVDASTAAAANANKALKSGIRLRNRGDGLRLERLQVAKWVGDIPSRDQQGKTNFALSNGGTVSGDIRNFDPSSRRFDLVSSAGAVSVALSDISEIRFSSPALASNRGQCALFLHGGMRLSGTLQRVNAKDWILGGRQYQRSVPIPYAMVRSMVVFQSDPAGTQSTRGVGRLGRLVMGDTQSVGRLLAEGGTANVGGLPMRWHPLHSENSARLSNAISGKVVYRTSPRVDRQSAAARMLEQQRLRNLRQKRGLNFGELFLQRANLSKQNPVKRDVHVLHLRSGDVIACRVESIDDRGVRVSTERSEDGFVPHAKIKAIELVSNSPPPNIDQAKRERLLTIPRLQKSSPPSHLLCSHNGDFLRCRLLGTQDVSYVVEVQQESFLVPQERVAQIIWFHPDESSAEENAAPEPLSASIERKDWNQYLGLVQVVLSDGKRVTFRPTGIADDAIEGENALVGECRFSLNAIDQIILGEQIATEVEDFAYNQWKMQPAVEPMVTAAMQGGAESQSGVDSPLVGSAAPEIQLELLGGEPFQLTSYRGQVVVLDFWASWCAPCMQTMPLLTAAMDEFDPASVRLISVNLEESAQQIESILERQKIQTTVALDIDGVTAQRYRASAIPQLVVVGTDGNVERVYVGGGQAVVDQMLVAVRQLLETAKESAP